ncbi:MAG: hypothetical protein J6W46_01700 [Spirochaetaceae bacterium]|nr:hypothetical protein [Spirochaetaceae bacterium]
MITKLLLSQMMLLFLLKISVKLTAQKKQFAAEKIMKKYAARFRQPLLYSMNFLRKTATNLILTATA